MPFVSNPTAGDVHVNTPLTNFGQKWLQNSANFVSVRAMPSIPSSKQTDIYYEFSRADFFRDEAQERADGAESSGSGFELDTKPFHCKVYAHHKDVTDRQRANQDGQVRLDNTATTFSIGKIALRREKLFLEAFFQPGIWGGDLDVIGGATANGWKAATSDPIQQMRDKLSEVQGKTGYRPNRLLFSHDAWEALIGNDAVIDRVRGGATTDLPALVMRKLIAMALEIEFIEVVNSVVNTAVKGADEATSFAGLPGQCLMYYAPATVNLEEPTAGARFLWTGLFGVTDSGIRVKRFRHELVSGDRIEAEMAVDDRVVAPELGYLLTNVVG